MKINITKQSQIIERMLEEIELTDDISVIRETVSTTTDKKDQVVSTRSYLTGNELEHGSVMLFNTNIREMHREYNIFQSMPKEFEYMRNGVDGDIFQKILNEGDGWADKYELLQCKWYDNTLRTLDGVEVAKRMWFDYMSGIDNSHFNLEELYVHLKGIDSIELLSNDVDLVPHYNRTEECFYHIRFVIRPTDEEWEKILLEDMCDEFRWRSSSEYIKYKALSYYKVLDFLKSNAK